MKAQIPTIPIPQYEVDDINVADFIRSNFPTWDDAAEWFGVSRPTIERWVNGRGTPHPTCYTAIAAFQLWQSKEVV